MGMKVQCPTCNTVYNLPKVPEKKVAGACKKCGGRIVIEPPDVPLSRHGVENQEKKISQFSPKKSSSENATNTINKIFKSKKMLIAFGTMAGIILLFSISLLSDQSKSGWKFLKWGMNYSEVESALKLNNYIKNSQKLSDFPSQYVTLLYDYNENRSFTRELGDTGRLPYRVDIIIHQGIKGYSVPREKNVVDTFVFYKGSLVGVKTEYLGSEAADQGLNFAKALQEEYGGKIYQPIDATRYVYESRSLKIILENSFSPYFYGTIISYFDPKKIELVLKEEAGWKTGIEKHKVNKAKEML